jgi:hypothetical protein
MPPAASPHLSDHPAGAHGRTDLARRRRPITARWPSVIAGSRPSPTRCWSSTRSAGSVLGKKELAEFGATGGATDMAAIGNRVLIVLDRDAVLEFELRGDDLALRETVDWESLGIRPRRVSVSRGEFWIGGEGGALRWSDRKRFLAGGGGRRRGSHSVHRRRGGHRRGRTGRLHRPSGLRNRIGRVSRRRDRAVRAPRQRPPRRWRSCCKATKRRPSG